MATSLGLALSRQKFGDSFDFLREQLGDDLVNVIPDYEIPNRNYSEEDYPFPWNHPRDLPADVVKGILPGSHRPFLAIRYVQEKTGKLALEFFFQRYSDQNWKRNWAATQHLTSHGIYKNTVVNFTVIKALLSGSSLEATEGRYLPVLSANYNQQTLPLADYPEATDWGNRMDAFCKRA